MSDKRDTQFFRRALFLGVLQFLLLLILIGRMYFLQIQEGQYYQLLAEGNRITLRPLLPLRGQLMDRHGAPLAQNETSFRALFLTDKKDQVETTLESLTQFIPLSPEDIDEALTLVHKKRSLESIVLKDQLSWKEVSAIELHSNDLPGISIDIGSLRFYPDDQLGAHLIGYISAPSEAEQEEDEALLVPELKIGKAGAEKLFDKRLRGTLGHCALEVNSRRKVVRELYQVPSVPGENITLTVDKRLQTYAQQVLSEHESAAAIVLDIQTGDILALVSTPSFDPNLFPPGIQKKDWVALNDNPYFPLTNKALAGLYAPGSTVKPFVALAALDLGIINKDTTIFCPGHMYVGSHKFHCWRKHGHGHVNVTRAIAESCDVFFFEVSKKIGIDRLVLAYKKMGFGAGGIDGFPHSKKGLVPTKEWKKEKKHSNWNVSDTVQVSIGQGYMLATPMELAVAMARLASQGKKVEPRLEITGSPTFEDLGCDPKHLEVVLDAMQQTTNIPGGTAFHARIPVEGMEMAGKTATTQVRRITLQQRLAGQTKTTNLPWKFREHGLFIGFAPVHAPRYAIAVIVEHAAGASPAVRAARDILLKAQLLETEPPS